MKKTSRAGVSDTRAGLQPAGLFSNAGIFKKGFQDFHPLDESPYLLFDAESSMLGNLENPTLDLDASKAETLDVITATRAGIATYTAADGQIVTADENTVRVDWSLGYPAMLIEPSATNLLSYSEDFSNWSKQDVSLSTGFASPDGLLNATNVTPNATNTTHLFSSVGLSSNIKTYSVYAKANGYKYFRFNTGSSGNGYAEFDVEAGTVVGTGGTYYSSSSIEDVGDGWFRCSMTLSAGAADFITIAIEDNSRAVSYLADGVSSLLFWGAQVETGSVATSYIPTSGGSVAERTRNADNLVIDGTAFSDFYNATEGTVYVELTSEDDGKNNYVAYFTQDIADYPERNNGTWAIQKDGIPNFYLASWANGGFVSNSLISLGAYTASNLTRVSVSYNSNSYEGSKDGAAVQTSTPTTMATTLVNRLYIGGSGIFQNSSRIKRLIYWPTHSDSL